MRPDSGTGRWSLEGEVDPVFFNVCLLFCHPERTLPQSQIYAE
jgi:hypothetical protein